MRARFHLMVSVLALAAVAVILGAVMRGNQDVSVSLLLKSSPALPDGSVPDDSQPAQPSWGWMNGGMQRKENAQVRTTSSSRTEEAQHQSLDAQSKQHLPTPAEAVPLQAAAEKLMRYKGMLSESQKILAAEQANYNSLVHNVQSTPAARGAGEDRVLAQIKRVSNLSARVGQATLRLQTLLRTDQAPSSESTAPLTSASPPQDIFDVGLGGGGVCACGVVFDVRTPAEFEHAHDLCAINLEIQTQPSAWHQRVLNALDAVFPADAARDKVRVAGLVDALPRSSADIFIVGSGEEDPRVTRAADLLRAQGYTAVRTATVGGRAYGPFTIEDVCAACKNPAPPSPQHDTNTSLQPEADVEGDTSAYAESDTRTAPHEEPAAVAPHRPPFYPPTPTDAEHAQQWAAEHVLPLQPGGAGNKKGGGHVKAAAAGAGRSADADDDFWGMQGSQKSKNQGRNEAEHASTHRGQIVAAYLKHQAPEASGVVGLGEASRGGERRSRGSSALRRRKVEEDEVFPDSTAAQQFGVNAREAGLKPAVAARVRHAKEMRQENDDSWRRVVTKMRRVLPVPSVARQKGSW